MTVGGTLKRNRFMLETGLQHESEGGVEGSHVAYWWFQVGATSERPAAPGPQPEPKRLALEQVSVPELALAPSP